MNSSTIGADAEKARQVYGDRVVDKRLAMQETFARLPRYVTEYLLAKYVRVGHESDDIAEIKQKLSGRIPESDQKELIKHSLQRDREYKLIDQLRVEVDLSAGRHWAGLSSLEGESIAIGSHLVDRFEGLLNGGLWGTITLRYDPTASVKEKIKVTEFIPFQVDKVDVSGYKEGRAHFSKAEWVRLLLRSAGYEPDQIPSERQQLLLLARLIPLVERNINLIELGPRGTGKTFLLRNLSPAVFTISGGRPTPATLFLHKQSNRIGILGSHKVVVFDEIVDVIFPDQEVVSTLKDFMESGQFSRGKKSMASDASLVFTGNLEVSGDQPSDAYRHLFEELPPSLIDTAFLDRVQGYLPGWEIPKISDALRAQGVGFVTDYFGEVLKQLRQDEIRSHFEAIELGPHATIRDQNGARRLAAGMFKILFPDGRCEDEELRDCLRLGVEFRQRVHNQLTVLAPGEYGLRAITFEGMLPLDARDLKENKKVQERDARANREPMMGHVTGLSVFSRGKAEMLGDIFFVEAKLLPDHPATVTVTGLRGPILRESVQTAYNVLQTLTGIWEEAAARARSGEMAVHLVNISEPKEGPSGGVAFVTAMVSATLGRPVRPGIAMTGEVSLHGNVEGVGGVAKKIIAAAQHQRKMVIIPVQNAKELEDVPDEVLEKIEVKTVERIEQVLELAIDIASD